MKKISIAKSSLSGSVIPPPSFEVAYRWIWGASLGEGGVFGNVADCENIQKISSLCKQIGADIQFDTDSNTIDIFGSQKPKQIRSIDCEKNSLVSRLALALAVSFDYGSVLKNTNISPRFLSKLDDVAKQLDFRITKLKDEISIHGPARNDTFELYDKFGAYWLNSFMFSSTFNLSDTFVFLDDFVFMHPSLKYTLQTFDTFEINYYNNPQDHFLLIPANQPFYSKYLQVPQSYKEASYYICAYLLSGSGDVAIPNDIYQPQIDFWKNIDVENAITYHSKFVHVRGGLPLSISNTIDIRPNCALIPLAILLATQAQEDVKIGPLYPISTLAQKRIDLTCEQLTKLGAKIQISDDFLTVSPSKLTGGQIDCTSDARVASALCLAGLICQKPLILHGPEIISSVNSRFLSDLKKMGANINVL